MEQLGSIDRSVHSGRNDSSGLSFGQLFWLASCLSDSYVSLSNQSCRLPNAANPMTSGGGNRQWIHKEGGRTAGIESESHNRQQTSLPSTSPPASCLTLSRLKHAATEVVDSNSMLFDVVPSLSMANLRIRRTVRRTLCPCRQVMTCLDLHCKSKMIQS